MSGLGHSAGAVAANRYPGIDLIIKAIDVSPNVKAPYLVFTSFVTERLERNGDFQRPAVGGDLTLRLHNDIDAEISITTFREYAILLHSQWIPTQDIRLPLIVESVEEDSQIVFAENIIATRDAGSHLGRIVKSMNPDIEKPRVVTEEDVGRFRGRDIVSGINLVEVS